MKKSRITMVILFLVGTAGLGMVHSAHADRGGDGGDHRGRETGIYRDEIPRGRGEGRHRRHRPRVPRLDSTLERLREETGARILSREPYRYDGGEGYRIRILTPEGRVRRLLIDPETGRLLRRRR